MSTISTAKKILFIVLLCNFIISSDLYSQKEYKRKISISEWIEEMEKCKDKKYYLLENTEIYYHYPKDTLYSYDQPKTEPSHKDTINAKNIYPIVVLSNCKFLDNTTSQLRNIIFHKNVSFSNCTGAGQVYIYNCTFKQGLDIFNSDLNWLKFIHSSILHRTVVYETKMGQLSFSNCSFRTDNKLVESYYDRGFEKENDVYQFLFLFGQNEKKINTLNFSRCKVLPSEVKPVLAFEGGKYDVIDFTEIDFSSGILGFFNCSVKENFTVLDCNINQPIGMYKFNFPKDNTSFHWSQIDSLGLGVYSDLEEPPYTHKTDTLSSDINIFNELNSSYRKFYSMYRTQGDNESANACLIQLKDMETTKYHQLYQQNPNIHTWFNWRFNQFLKYFSKYGTNPVQSLIISMWTILVFAGVYFFFYSNWDGINRSFLIKQHRKVMQYFRSQQRLEDFYTEKYMEDFKTFAEYKNEIKESKVELPVFIVLLGRPLYLLSVIKHKVIAFIYRRTEILHGRWVDLKPARKIMVGATAFFSIVVYIIGLAIVRALNSITLSINAFSTLGFGSIPVKGLSRYITIIEGFLGWFLLSIFSVSLISQMLQN